MHDKEVFKPSNTGWLIADVIDDTTAFIWSRTEVDRSCSLLADPQWQPYIVFPGEFVAPERVVSTVDVMRASARCSSCWMAPGPSAQDVPQKPVSGALPVLSLRRAALALSPASFQAR
jgi:DTW domain-containing protein YfiP